MNTQSYMKCLNVGVGKGEYCKCNQAVVVVGYYYNRCLENFDVGKLLWCALRGGWCYAVCIATMSASSCANCLAGASNDCCNGGQCGVCDFVISCDPYEAEEIHDNVYMDVGC